MAEFTAPALKTCSSCGNTYPDTKQFFYTNKILSDGTVLLKTQCKDCIKKVRNNTRAKERVNGFQWDKITQSRFKNISKTIQQHNLQPYEVLKLTRVKASELSYNLGARLNAVKSAIKEQHPEAMRVLFLTPQEDTNFPDLDSSSDIPNDEVSIFTNDPPPMQSALTLRIAAQRLLDFETNLERANLDMETARRMLEEAEQTIRAIKSERNEAVRFLADMAKELEDE